MIHAILCNSPLHVNDIKWHHAFKTINRYGELEDVEANLSSGVDANHQDAHGNTALHLSCANGHADVIRALIKAGASHLPNAAGNRCG